MTHANVKDYDKAKDTAARLLSPRYLLLDRFDRFVEGTQYEGRPDWFTAVDTPLAERAPCVVYQAAEIAIESYCDLLVGEHRFPYIEVKKGGKDETKTGAEGTTPKGLAKFIKRNGFKALVREIIAAGLGCGTGVIILGLREGKAFADTVPAKWCTPEFVPGTQTVTKLVIEYPYIKVEQEPLEGKWVAKVFAFHREITDEHDMTALPVEIVSQQAMFRWDTQEWTPDPKRTVVHGLGFVPVIWWARARGATVEARIDGHPIHEHLLDEITQHDIALSQRQSAAFLAGSPQWTEVGVEPGFNPTGEARQQSVPATPHGGPLGKDNRPTGSYAAPQTGGGRKKGPANVWQYPAGVVVDLHQLNAGALEAISANARDLRTKICEGMAVVLMDPENLPNLGTMSGEAQKMFRERQLARCDTIRDDVCDNLLRPIVVMLSKLTDKVEIDPEDVNCEWPPYIKPSKTEKAATIQQTVTAISAAIIAVPSPTFKKLARMAIVDEIEDDLDEEEREEIERELDEAEAAEPEEMQEPQGPEGEEEEPGAKKPEPAAPPPGQHPPPKTRVTKETWGGPA